MSVTAQYGNRNKENIMLFALALIPVIALLVFIYFKDKNEKEPIGLLIGLFFAGMGSIITAVIIEGIGQLIIDALIYNRAVNVFIFAMIVVGPAEELGKYAVLRLITWKNKNFNYSYDAIVYAVCASLGFAAIENVGYVFQNGWGTAILRMFTAVPGHTCFAVLMGYFYSKAKYASVTNNKGSYAKNQALSLIIPIVGHGLYDAIIMASGESEDGIAVLGALLWIGYVIALFVLCFIIVLKASKNDFCIITLPESVQTVYKPAAVGTWKCTCGKDNYLNFCAECGKARPLGNTWNCPKCGMPCTFNFCGNCGTPRSTPAAN